MPNGDNSGPEVIPSPALAARLSGFARFRRLLNWVSRLDPFYRPENGNFTGAPPERIVVPLLWGLGDAVLALPLIQALAKRWPKAEILIPGKPGLAELFTGEPVRIVVSDAPWTQSAGKYKIWGASWRTFLCQIRMLRALKADLWVSLRFDPREAVLARLCRPRRIFGFADAGGRDWLWADFGMDAAQFARTYGGTVAAAAAERVLSQTVSDRPRFSDDPERSARAARSIPARRAFAAVAFGASHPIRRWSMEKIVTVIHGLAARGLDVAVIDDGSHNWPDDLFRPENDAGPAIFRLRGGLDSLKDALSACHLFVGCDSGPMHMAAAMGRPVVAIFGPGSIERFSPKGDAIEVVAHHPMPCRPCFDCCLYDSPVCMDVLEPPAVLAAIDRLGLATSARIN